VSNGDDPRFQTYKELENLTYEMNYDVDAVIVEGSHDKRTLQSMSYSKAIIPCSTKSFDKLANSIKRHYQRTAILTDFDEEGIIMNEKLSNLLTEKGVEVENFYRARFEELLYQLGLYTIEGIYGVKREIFF
jgi:5S rRNA maturation endonuclease (ribonuclease M5)